MGLRAVFLVAALLVMLGHPAEAKRQYAAIVIDHTTGRELHASKADMALFPASLTKMMTLYMLFEAIERGEVSLATRFRISKRAEGMPASKLGLTAGNTIKVEDLLLALVVKSANDAAVVVAEGLGGSEASFAQAMTRRARDLGMRRTTFRNASGLPDVVQKSTARDMAILARRLIIDHQRFYPYFARKTFRYGNRTYRSHNRLMARYSGMDGLKTGYIRASGFNLAASAVRGGRRVTAVVFGGRTANSRDNEVARLLDLGFERVRRLPARDLLIAGPPVPRPEITAASVVPRPERRAPEHGAFVTVNGRPSEVPAAGYDIVTAAVEESGEAKARVPAVKAEDPGMVDVVPTARPHGLRLRVGPPKLQARGIYGVQVGAYHDPDAARRRAYEATRYIPELLLQGDVEVSALQGRRGMVYRSRFVGLSREVALQACDTLKRQQVDCLVVRIDSLQLARN